MSFEKKTWGSYEWDDNKSTLENIQAAKTQNAVIETSDLQRIEDGIQDALSKTANDIDLIRPSTGSVNLGEIVNDILDGQEEGIKAMNNKIIWLYDVLSNIVIELEIDESAIDPGYENPFVAH